MFDDSSAFGIIEGIEHVPADPVIFFSKHQSTWETIALGGLLPPTVWVVKRELLWVPFFGWYLKRYGVAAVDRGGGAHGLPSASRVCRSER